jgi:hypothetical protein
MLGSIGAISLGGTGNGASLSGSVLCLAPADANCGGIVTDSIQTFAGKKTIDINIAGGPTGSIPYQSATSKTTLLSVGATGTVLTSSGLNLAPTWRNIQRPFVYLSLVYSAIAAPAGTDLTMPLTALNGGDIWRGNGIIAPTGTQLFLPQTGYYSVTCQITLLSNSKSDPGNGYVVIQLLKNNADITVNGTSANGKSSSFGQASNKVGSGNAYQTISTTGIAKCTTAITDYLSFVTTNSSSATITFYSCNISVFKISDL